MGFFLGVLAKNNYHGALIVYDHFHVIKRINEAVNHVRNKCVLSLRNQEKMKVMKK